MDGRQHRDGARPNHPADWPNARRIRKPPDLEQNATDLLQERILHHAVTQRFEVSSSGALLPLTEGSTRPVSVQVTGAGAAVVEVFELRMR